MEMLSGYLDMGGYATFVWPAFAVTAAVLLVLWLDSLRRLRAWQRTLARLERELPARPGGGPASGRGPAGPAASADSTA